MEISAFQQKIQTICQKKVDLLSESFGRYAFRSTLAGAFLTMSTAGGALAADSLSAINPTLGRLLFAFLFAWGLVYIVFLNAELATSNMMYLTAGLWYKAIKPRDAFNVLFVCTLFNLLGAIICGWLFNQSTFYELMPESNFFVTVVNMKLAKSTGGIFIEGILANLFVNIAIMAFVLIQDSAAKLPIILSAITLFVFLGNEHVVANFGSFALGFFSQHRDLINFSFWGVLHQWTFAYLGNIVGGGLIIGLGYAWLNQSKTNYLE